MNYNKEFKNISAPYYFIADVKKGKSYRISFVADKKIMIHYKIYDNNFSEVLELTPIVEVYRGKASHIVHAKHDGKLVFCSHANDTKFFWSKMTIESFKEV
jgi:hypothetical protein